jgi:hypothetical protein
VTLEPFERDHACVIGGYRMPKKQKVSASSWALLKEFIAQIYIKIREKVEFLRIRFQTKESFAEVIGKILKLSFE